MWYNRITQDLGVLPDFVAYYQNEYEAARRETGVKGNIERNLSALPGITEYRFNQLQEIEAVLNYLNIQLRGIRRRHFQKYLENYQRALSSRDVDKYVDGEKEVLDYEVLINEVALLRNQYLGILKGLESKNFMLGHITRLKVAGMEDAVIS
jgi:hypothetical protein